MGMSNFTGNSGNGSGMPPISQLAGGGNIDITDMLIDYNDRFKSADPTLFRDDIITQTMSVLIGMFKPNPMLIGSAGVGKTKIVEDIARRIANDDPTVPRQLRKYTVYELPLANIVAGAGIVGQLEQRVTELVDWASDKSNHAILFIDEIHMLASDRMAIYDKIAQILKPALGRGDIRVIGATTLQESRNFDDDPALSRRLSRIIVDELDQAQTIAILHRAKPSMIAHYKNKVTISDDTLDKVSAIADRNSKAGQHRPDNALTLLDRAMADRVLQHSTAVAAAQAMGDTNLVQALTSVATLSVNENQIISTAMRLMTGHATKNRLDLGSLQNKLTRIKGQKSILDDLIDMVRRDELDIFPRKLPITWLFAGSSGAGKTEVAKIIAQELTGQPPIIINMTEYIHDSSINRLIGSPPGYIGSDSNGELPFDTLESNPYRVILLDEVEKSDKAVQRLFLSAFDEGYIKTARGKIIDFSKSIIIATTNAARDVAGKPSLGFAPAVDQSQIKLVSELKKWFDAEFLSRFSKILAFNPINKDIYREILVSSYVIQRDQLVQENHRMLSVLPSSIPDDDLDMIIDSTFASDLGARPAVRAVRQYIEETVMASRSNTVFPTAPFINDDEIDDGIETSPDAGDDWQQGYGTDEKSQD